MKETTKFVDGIPTKSPYSEMEKELARKYPNFTPVMFEMVKNVNLVMKITLGLFIVQAICLLGFIAFSM